MYRLLLGCTLLQANKLAGTNPCAQVSNTLTRFEEMMCVTKDGENVLHTMMFLHGLCRSLIIGIDHGVYDYEEDGFFDEYSEIRFKRNPLFKKNAVDTNNIEHNESDAYLVINQLFQIKDYNSNDNINSESSVTDGLNDYGEFKYFFEFTKNNQG
jgi:hypothetical protein